MKIAGAILAALFVLAVIGHMLFAPTPATDTASTTPAGSTRAVNGGVVLRSLMRDPSSFQMTQLLVMHDGATACYSYRSRNGFNGYVDGFAVLTPADKVITDEGDGFESAWTQYCRHKKGADIVDTFNALKVKP
jgi:hypothetical protein